MVSSSSAADPDRAGCRVCDGRVTEFLDLGKQPLSDAFPPVPEPGEELFYRLTAGRREGFTMVQLLEEVPRARVFDEDYPYFSTSSAVTDFCGIGTEPVARVYDSTPAKQGRVAPGAHIPVVPAERFADDRPDVAVLFAWNHAEEIMAKERACRRHVGAVCA